MMRVASFRHLEGVIFTLHNVCSPKAENGKDERLTDRNGDTALCLLHNIK